MINPTNRQSRRMALSVSLGASLLGLATACSEEAPETSRVDTPIERNYDPTPAPAPRALTAADLDLKPGVEYPTPRIPSDAELARSIATLAGALATGDDAALAGVLTPEAQAVLASLVDSGLWAETAASIEAVRVCTILEMGAEANVGLGIADATGVYLMGWTATNDGGTWRFGGMAITPAEADTVAGLDGTALELAALPLAAPVVETPVDVPVEQEPEPTPPADTGGGRGRPSG